jgi:hypothetical protein
MFVAGGEVLQKLVKQVAPSAAIPQVMVRIENLELWFEDLLVPLTEPCITNGIVGALAAG